MQWRGPPAKFRCTNCASQIFALMSLSASEFCAWSGVEAVRTSRRAHKPVRVISASAVKVSLMINSMPLGEYTSHRLQGIHHAREGTVQGPKSGDGTGVSAFFPPNVAAKLGASFGDIMVVERGDLFAVRFELCDWCHGAGSRGLWCRSEKLSTPGLPAGASARLSGWAAGLPRCARRPD